MLNSMNKAETGGKKMTVVTRNRTVVAAWCTTETFSTTHAVYKGLLSADGCLVVVAQW